MNKKSASIRITIHGALILLSAVYLTFIVDAYTLDSMLQRVFVFLYFCGIGVLLVWLKGKYLGASEKRDVVISLFLSILIVLSMHSSLLPNVEKQTIILRANVTDNFPQGEIWLLGAEIDGASVEASALNDVEMKGWIFSSEYDDYVFYPSGEPEDNMLSFSVMGKELSLIFGGNSWSGTVLVEANNSVEAFILQNNDIEYSTLLNYTLQFGSERTMAEQILFGAGAIIVISFFISCAIGLLGRKKKGCQSIFTLIYLISALLLFGSSPLIAPSAGTKLLLAVITIGIAAFLQSADFGEKRKLSRGVIAAMFFIAAYSSFASFGYRFFFYGDTLPVFSLSGIGYCLLGTIWFFPLILGFLTVFERFRLKERAERTPRENRRAFLIILGVLLACQCIPLIAFWPGEFPIDCTSQLGQILGVYAFSDWHPFIHTLFVGAVISVFHTAGAVVAVQMFLFVLLLALVLKEGYERCIGLAPLCIVGGLFVLMPNQVFTFLLAEKDTPYAIALLWAIWLIYRLIKSKGEKGLLLYIAVAINLFIVGTVRHNGIVPFAAMAVFYVIYAIANKKYLIRLISAVLASILLFAAYKGPLFHKLNVEKNGMSAYTVMLCAVGSCINKDLPLSDETYELMERIMPLEDWKTYYGRFVGHDYYMWGGGSGMNLEGLTAGEAFSAYFDALSRYPDVVIKDRLDGTNLLWDVSQPRDGWNARAFDFVQYDANLTEIIDYSRLEKAEYADEYFNHSAVADFYRIALNSRANMALDMIIWRTGAYLIVFLALILYWVKNKRWGLLWCSVPMLGNLAGLAISLYHQSFRYVYPVQLAAVALIFFTLISGQTVNSKERDKTDENRSIDPLL